MASDAPSVLRKIVAHKREEVAAAKAVRPRIDVDGLPPTRGFAAAIRRGRGFGRGQGSGVRGQTGRVKGEPVFDFPDPWPLAPDPWPLAPDPCGVRLIAEVKHASPVKGVLRAEF